MPHSHVAAAVSCGFDKWQVPGVYKRKKRVAKDVRTNGSLGHVSFSSGENVNAASGILLPSRRVWGPIKKGVYGYRWSKRVYLHSLKLLRSCQITGGVDRAAGSLQGNALLSVGGFSD